MSLRLNRVRLGAFLALVVAAGLVLAGCNVQQGNTYPIDFFTGMHYSPSIRDNEPTRLTPAEADLVYIMGDPAGVYQVPDENRRTYQPERAAELYRINCSVCHGVAGLGDGAATPYITASDSFYATTEGVPYEAPPNLISSRQEFTPESMYVTIVNGIRVMPAFGNILSEESIREIVDYVYDTDSGLGF